MWKSNVLRNKLKDARILYGEEIERLKDAIGNRDKLLFTCKDFISDENLLLLIELKLKEFKEGENK